MVCVKRVGIFFQAFSFFFVMSRADLEKKIYTYVDKLEIRNSISLG